jgi:hypothetical protein
MMLLREPQSLRRHPSLGDPAADMSLRVVAAALGRRASQAIAEHQRLGRDEFLETWGFGRATRYLLRVGGRFLDPKQFGAGAPTRAVGRS